MEYQEHIDFYASYHWAGFSKLVPSVIWGDKKLAEEYLQKYWLTEQDYQKVWKPIQDEIFNQKNLPELVYRSEFAMIALRGGCLFVEEDFRQLQKAMTEVGDDHFVVIQHSQEFTDGEPMFRLKFPVNISWEELISGNYISAVVLEMSYNNYFVVASKGNWGKYSANDYKNPLDIIGFKPELALVFKEHFRTSKEEQEEIREWLPQEYKIVVK